MLKLAMEACSPKALGVILAEASTPFSQDVLDAALLVAARLGPDKYSENAMSGSEASSCVRLLGAAGAHVNSRCLNRAADHGSSEAFAALVQLAVDQGFNVDHVDKKKRTALFVAAMSEGENPDVARILAAAGADMNHRDRYGWIALHGAACKGNWEIFHAMVELGANPDALEARGMDPLECAKEQGLADTEVLHHKARILAWRERSALSASTHRVSPMKSKTL